ncbi:MAG: DoxX family protein [Pseudomonadota bacterium]
MSVLPIARNASAAILAAFMVFIGVQKFGGDNTVFSYIAAQSGLSIFEPGVRLLTGLAELLAAALLVGGFFIARLRGLGGLLSLGVIGGAIVFHLSPWLGINAPVAFDEAGGYVFSPILFIMAVVFFSLSLIHVWLERTSLMAWAPRTPSNT